MSVREAMGFDLDRFASDSLDGESAPIDRRQDCVDNGARATIGHWRISNVSHA